MSLGPPTDEYEALVALDKASDVDPGGARARLELRLAAQLHPSVGGRAEAPRPPRSTGSLRGLSGTGAARLAQLALFGAGVGVGVGARSLVPPPPPPAQIRYVDRVVEVVRPAEKAASVEAAPIVPAPPPATSSAPNPSPPHAEKQATSAAPTPGTAPTAAPGGASNEELGRERQLIERAQAALARRNAAAALDALDQHARDFPHGQMTEMREALAVQALAFAGRGADARARAERFHRLFPGSMYRPVVDNALSSIP